jgi:hypothetical protein
MCFPTTCSSLSTYLYFFLKQLVGATPTREIKSIDNYYIRQHKIKLVWKMCKHTSVSFETACRCSTLICHLAKSAGLGEMCDKKIWKYVYSCITKCVTQINTLPTWVSIVLQGQHPNCSMESVTIPQITIYSKYIHTIRSNIKHLCYS